MNSSCRELRVRWAATGYSWFSLISWLFVMVERQDCDSSDGGIEDMDVRGFKVTLRDDIRWERIDLHRVY